MKLSHGILGCIGLFVVGAALTAAQAAPAPKTLSLTLAASAAGAISLPGQEDDFTFTGSVGQRLYYDTLDLSYNYLYAQLIAPSGAIAGLYTDTSYERAPFYLTEAGLYTLKLYGSGNATGSYNFRLLDTGAAPVVTVGPTNTVLLNPSSRTEIYRFAGTAGQRICLQTVSNSAPGGTWSLINPANQSLASGAIDTDLGTNDLRVSGTYLVVVAGTVEDGPAVDFRFRILDVSEAPVSPTGFGSVHSGAVASGETNRFTYTAATGTVVLYDSLIGYNSAGLSAQLIDPDGAAVFGADGSYDAGPFVLTRTGSYTLELTGTWGGNYSFRLLNLATDSLPLTFGSTNTAALVPPFRADVFRFQATPGQRLFYDALDGNSGNLALTLWSPTLAQVLSYYPGSTGDYGLIPLTEPGTFYLVQSDYNAGDTSAGYSFRLLELGQAPALSLALNTFVTNTLAPASQAMVYRFEGTAGQRLFFDSLNADNGASWYLDGPQNATIAAVNIASDFTLTLPQTGTYALRVQGSGTSPIAYAFRVVTAATTNFALTLGAVTTGALTASGEEHQYAFAGSAGQRLYYDALQNDVRDISVRLLDPRGNVTLLNQNYIAQSGPFTLPEAGAYTLAVGGLSDAVGGYSFRLLDAALPPVLPLSFNTLYSGSNTMSLGALVFRFVGTAGQRLFLDGQLADNAAWTVYGTDNSMYVGQGLPLGYDFEITLTKSGTNLLVLEAGLPDPFGYSFRVVAPVTTTNSLTLGTVVSNVLAGPGDEHWFTFTGTLGQRLYYDGLDADNANVTATLFSPNGSVVWSYNSDSDSPLITLTTPGTYTLVQHNSTDHPAPDWFRLLDVASQPAISLGVLQSGQLNPLTQSHLYRFSGAAGQRIQFDSVLASSASANWFFYAPNNSILAGATITASLGAISLPVSGTYVVVIQGGGASTDTLDYQVRLTDVSEAPVAATGFGTFTGTVAANDTNLFTFTAAAGTRIYLDSLTNNNSILLSLIDHNGNPVFQNAAAAQGAPDPGMFILPTSGLYTFQVVGWFGGDYAFRLVNLDAEATPLGFGTAYTGTFTNGYQTALFKFTGTPGQRLVYDGLEGDHDSVYWALFSPSGATVFSGYWWWLNADDDYGPITLTESGTYYLGILGGTPDTNHYAFRMLDVNQAPCVSTSLGVTNGIGLAMVPASALSLTGSYIDTTLNSVDDPDWRASQTIAGTRPDSSLSFYATNWGSRASVGVTGGSDNNWLGFSVQWDGQVTIAAPNTRLYLYNDGGARMWLDLDHNSVFDSSELMSNYWGSAAYYPSLGSVSPPLAAGTYRLRLQYVSGFSAGQMSLFWDSGYSLGPYEAKAFRFNAGPGPLFFDSFLPAGANWAHYRPGSDSTAAWMGGLSDFESTSDQAGTNLVVLFNPLGTAQPYSFRILAPVAVTNALTLGNKYTASVTAGQDVAFTFAALAGQRLYYDALDPASGNITVTLIAPSGLAVVSASHYYDEGPLTLTESGACTLLFHNHSDATTDCNFRLLDVAAQPFIALDATNNVSLSLGTTAALFQLNSLAHLRLFFEALLPAVGSAYWYVYGPNNQSLAATSAGSYLTIDDPALTATYLLVINANDTNSQNYSFRVVPGNHAPALGPIANQAIDEMVPFSFASTVTDPESDNQRFTFTLDSGAPAGAALDPLTGAFSWTPTEAQGPGLYPITVRVTDDGTPPLSDAKNFTLTVNEVNRVPVLTVPGPQVINELTPLNVSASATDPDLPANTLTFGLVSPPNGITINPNTGAISWTPAEDQGPGFYTIAVRVFDNGVPSLATTNTFTVTVNEVNSAPVLTAPTNQTINELALWTANATASDSDLPANTLTFERVAGPSGLTVGSAGLISWTPTEAQGPSTNLVTVRVFDNGVPSLSATNSFTLIVNEVNSAPVLTAPTNQTINELVLWTANATAVDTDAPPNTLTFERVAGPSGLTVSAAGAISWTPTEAQGPSTNLVTVRVFDNGTPSLSVTNSFTLIVNEVNSAPVLTVPTNQAINELVLWTGNATAVDTDSPPNSLTFERVAGPSGLTVSAAGAISWTPTEAQGPGTNVVTVRVFDNGVPSLSATNSFTLIVNEVNSAPVLAGLTNRTVNPGQSIDFAATATDADSPSNALTFSLVGPPAGASINSGSGVFSWRPSIAQANAAYTLQVQVTDNNPAAVNAQHLSDTKSFTVTVNPLAPVRLTPVSLAGGQFQIQIDGPVGPDYTLLASTTLTNWSSLGLTNPTATPFRMTDAGAGAFTNRFYRVRLSP